MKRDPSAAWRGSFALRLGSGQAGANEEENRAASVGMTGVGGWERGKITTVSDGIGQFGSTAGERVGSSQPIAARKFASADRLVALRLRQRRLRIRGARLRLRDLDGSCACAATNRLA